MRRGYEAVIIAAIGAAIGAILILINTDGSGNPSFKTDYEGDDRVSVQKIWDKPNKTWRNVVQYSDYTVYYEFWRYGKPPNHLEFGFESLDQKNWYLFSKHWFELFDRWEFDIFRCEGRLR